MGRGPHKRKDPRWVTARRIARDSSDETHYNKLVGDEDPSANSLTISVGGDDQSESNPSIH